LKMMHRVGIVVGSVLLAVSDDTAAGIGMVHTFLVGDWMQRMRYNSRLVMPALEHAALVGLLAALFLWDAHVVYALPFLLWCAVVTVQWFVKSKGRTSMQGDGERNSVETAQQIAGRNHGDFESKTQNSEEDLTEVRV